MNKNTLLNEFKRYFFMVIGCICYAMSLAVFLIPNKIVGGGVSGAAAQPRQRDGRVGAAARMQRKAFAVFLTACMGDALKTLKDQVDAAVAQAQDVVHFAYLHLPV